MSYKKYINFDGRIREEWRNDVGELHREDGPAATYYYADGSINCELFYVSGFLHRESGPTTTSYYADGSINCELFYVSGEFLGRGNEGFWALWGRIAEEGRQAPDILKCLVRYS